jgi:hypothetical protein
MVGCGILAIVSPRTAQKVAFTAFLSHQYRATDVNCFFFDLFDRAAEVQFEIDEGAFATNVTRLERKVRNADAFVGIYPLSAHDPDPVKESRYFRLELDIAARSGKPALVLYDGRYRDDLTRPPGARMLPFDNRQIVGSGQKPDTGRFEKAFQSFRDAVSARRRFEVEATLGPRGTAVGLLLDRYPDRALDAVRESLRRARYEPVDVPSVLGASFFATLPRLDFAVVDVANPELAPGVAFLHGAFVPMLRLKRLEGEDVASPLEAKLFGNLEVGYPKDVVRWRDDGELAAGLAARLTSLDAASVRIATRTEALEYFRRASLRKESVFLSYSGNDREAAGRISAALRARFQRVFDYRDAGTSIPPGREWGREVFDALSQSGVGVPLLSATYFESGNCRHELDEMVALRDAGRLKLVPVKLDEAPLDLPSNLRSTQYLRLWEHPDVVAVVRMIEVALAAPAN